MKNSQIATTILALDKREIRELKKWLASPFHNQRDDVYQLFLYLCKHLASENSNGRQLSKEKVFRHLFPQETYDDARLRQVAHFLQKAIEDYLAYSSFRAHPVRSELELARVFRKKNLDKSFSKQMRGLEKIQQKRPERDEYFFLDQFSIELEAYEYNSRYKRTADLNLQEVDQSWETAFLIGKLRLACFMVSNQRVAKQDYDLGMAKQILFYIDEKKLISIPAIRAYYYCFKSFTETTNEDHFFNFKEAIYQHGQVFSATDLQNLYQLAINYCIRKMNRGEALFKRETFNLYKMAIESDVFFENGVLYHFAFKNATSLGTALREFEWVQNFIDYYKDYLSPEYRDTFVKYSLAFLNYEKKEFTKAQRLLLQMDTDDLLLNLNAKWMLIRIYYKEAEFQPLESLLDSMKTYINRKKVLGYHRDSYSNLIKFTRKLMRVNPYDKDKKGKLREEIQQANPLIAKDWFLEQLEAL